MALINHIPFGLRIEDQQYVDVADVPKGRQCGCICPSCRIPLIARQGKANRWHFAHASRNVDEIEKECSFSFFVSVRTMAKQLLESGLVITLPEWRDWIREKRHGELFVEGYWIARASDVLLKEVQKEYFFEDILVDIYGKVGNYPLVIYFTHPGRALPYELVDPQQQSSGVIEIRLDETIKLFAKKNMTGVRFIDELQTFIQHDKDAKRWVYHPRKNKEQNEARIRLDKQVENYRPRPADKKRVYGQTLLGMGLNRQSYRCGMCGCEWSILETERIICPNCRYGRLYARKL